MIRFLAKLWNRRYMVLALVIVLIVGSFLLPSKTQDTTDTSLGGSFGSDHVNVSGDTTDRVVTMYVNQSTTLYAKPNLNSKQISTVTEGTMVQNVQPAKDGWSSIEYNNDKVYVQDEYLVEEYIIETEPTQSPTEPPFEPHMSEDGKWLIVQEDVRTEGNVWLRKAPGGEKLLLIENHEQLYRTEIGVNGWSKVTAPDGTEGYISTFYLMPVNKVNYEEVEEYVIVTEDARVRSSGSITSDQKGWAIKGDKYVRVGISQHGWSQILYKGKVCYIFSNYITAVEGPVDAEDLGDYVAPSKDVRAE